MSACVLVCLGARGVMHAHSCGTMHVYLHGGEFLIAGWHDGDHACREQLRNCRYAPILRVSTQVRHPPARGSEPRE